MRICGIALVLLILIGIVGYAKNTHTNTATQLDGESAYIDSIVDSISIRLLSTVSTNNQSSSHDAELDFSNAFNLQNFIPSDMDELFEEAGLDSTRESKLQNALTTIQTKAPSKPFLALIQKGNTPNNTNPDFSNTNTNNIDSHTATNTNNPTSTTNTNDHNMPTLQLPLDFNLNAWIPRLLQIIGTTNTEALTTRSGICGTCMLHTYQIIAEFMHFHNAPPLSGGYFFDAIPNTNPFHSFQQRNALLFDTLNDIIEYYGRSNLTQHTEIFNNTVEVAFASSISMLPQYSWNLVGSASTTPEINTLLSNIFTQSAPGSMYLTVLMRYIPESHTIRGHAVVTIRASNGFIVIPTNISGISLSGLRSYTQLATTPQELQRRYTMRLSGAPLGLVGLAFLEIREPFNLPFASALSFRDCSGFGEDRRGNLGIPTASTLNQCSSGRCIK